MKFVPQKATKGQTIAKFLAAHSVSKNPKLYKVILDKTIEVNATSRDGVWQMLFDSAARMGSKGKVIRGAVIVFFSPMNDMLPYAYSLMEQCSNNVTKYNALTIELQIAKGMGVKYLEVYGNSKLIISQVKSEYEVRNEDLVPYYQATII